MDPTVFDALTNQLRMWLDTANELPGTTAFVAGAFGWFLVENIIRRFASIMRTALMFGLIAAAGLSIVALVQFVTNDGDTSGLTTDLSAEPSAEATDL